MNGEELKKHFQQHYQKCYYYRTAYNFLTKCLSLDGIRHPSIYPVKGPGLPLIREADGLQNTRLNGLVNMLLKEKHEFNDD